MNLKVRQSEPDEDTPVRRSSGRIEDPESSNHKQKKDEQA